MTQRLFKHVARVTAYRQRAGTPGGFIFGNAQFFDLPNATIITGLRIQFKVTKSVDSEPNPGELTITNASEQTRVNLQTKPLRLKIEAGFDGNYRHVFTGDLRHGYSELNGSDWETKLRLGDGDQAWRYARVNKTYKRGANVATMIQYAASTMGFIIDAKTLASPELQAQVASGRALEGPTRDELTRLLAPYGYHWSMQDGQIQILRDDETRADTARVISEETGMIGSPTFGAPGKNGKPAMLNIKSRLYPELTPGARVVVRARAINGTFRMEKLTHSGDTHGDDRTTEIEAKPSP